MPAASIEVKGAKEAIEGLKRIDRSLASELKRGMKEDAKPILQDARGNARSLGGSGAYASSMAMRTIKDGVRIQSDDPAAGVIEFAPRGAFSRTGKRAGLPLGVPSGAPPRALVRASLDNEEDVRKSVESRIERVIERCLNG